MSQHTLFLFDTWSIQDGWLHTIIRQGRKSLGVSYDEALSDVTVGLVRMYQYLLRNKAYTFSEWTHEGSLIFASRMMKGGAVKFIVSCTYKEYNRITDWQTEWHVLKQHPERGIIFQETYTKEELLTALDTWFKALLRHPDFPFQYPCFCDGLDDEAYDKAIEKAKELTQGCVNEEYQVIENKIVREAVPLTREGLKFYALYKRMLKDHIIPKGWT